MYSSKLSAAFLLACFMLTLGLAASCGGGDETSESRNGGPTQEETSEATPAPGGGNTQEQGGGATGQDESSSSEIKIALGDILLVDVEKRRVVLRPVRGERQAFKVVPGAEVTLDDEPAELADLEQGQQAQIQYVIKKDQEHARAVDAFSANGSN